VAQERVLTPPFIVSMSPPGYPSAWLRPRSARFRFARQVHCSPAVPCCSQHRGVPLYSAKNPRSGQTRTVGVIAACNSYSRPSNYSAAQPWD
jgi:hypothetical protein